MLIESQYLPPVSVFQDIITSDSLYWEAHENYQKQTYRNRCYILTSNGVQLLTVPIAKSSSKTIRDIKIDYSQNWQQVHTRAIRTAYGKSAFFEHYFEALEIIIMSKSTFLFDLNVDLMTKCLAILKIDRKINFTEDFNKTVDISIDDKRGLITPETTFPVTCASGPQYYQLFGDKFVTNLSIIDLILNEGTNSHEFLYNS